MVNNDSFAVIIPVYNAESYLADCLDSLISQDYHNWFAYCVDDGSIDASGKILDSYAEKDSRIRVFHKANSGVSSSRNYALDRIGTEQWISFLDADDYLSPYFFSDIVNSIKLNRDNMIDYIRLFPKITANRYNKSGVCIINANPENHPYIVSNAEYFKNEDVGGYVASLVVKAEIVKEHNVRFVESMKILEDQVFSINCASHASNIMIISGNYYYYYSNPDSTTKLFVDRSNDIIQCINSIREVFIKREEKILMDYFNVRFMPIKIHMLINERVKHIKSSPKYKLYSSFDIGEFKLSLIDVVIYYFLKFLKRI